MTVTKIFPFAILFVGSCAIAAIVSSQGLEPAQKLPKTWDTLMNTPEMEVGLDPGSLKVAARNNGFEISTNFRITFHQPIDVSGKQEKGSYYVNRMTAICNTGEMRVDTSDVYTEKDQLLATGKNLGTLANPKDPKSFITQWVFVMCKDLKGKHPPTEA